MRGLRTRDDFVGSECKPMAMVKVGPGRMRCGHVAMVGCKYLIGCVIGILLPAQYIFIFFVVVVVAADGSFVN